jgi:hypothetical protein
MGFGHRPCYTMIDFVGSQRRVGVASRACKRAVRVSEGGRAGDSAEQSSLQARVKQSSPIDARNDGLDVSIAIAGHFAGTGQKKPPHEWGGSSLFNYPAGFPSGLIYCGPPDCEGIEVSVQS